MDNKKIHSIWDILVPQDTTDPEMLVNQPERRKITYTPDLEIKPISNPNPIPINTGKINVQANADLAQTGSSVKLASASETGHRPIDTINQPNTGAGTKKQEDRTFRSNGNERSTGKHNETRDESSNRSSSDKNYWKVIAAVVTLIIILGSTYFINERIIDNRKKRTDKNNDDFFDTFFDSKTGNIVRFSGIALLLVVAALAILYSTKLLVKGFDGVNETVND